MNPILYLLGCIVEVLLILDVHRTTFAFTSNNAPRHPTSNPIRHTSPSIATQKRESIVQMARYGPPNINFNPDSNDDESNDSKPSDDAYRSNIKSQFTRILHEVMNAKAVEELPSLLTKNIDTLIAAMTVPDMIEEIIQEDVQGSCDNEERLEEISNAVNMIVTFVESFVEEAKSMDDVYKKLLGKIFRLITPSGNNQMESEDIASVQGSMEMNLDEVLAQEKEAFTPGFLRHLEGECGRIAALPTLSPESAKMLQILRLIQTRVLEELGKGIGEGAIVLGQLLGYDDKGERLAVLDAGLTVRGVEFACELSALIGEALKGFENVKDVDPGLVTSIREIDERIGLFMEKSRFQ